ncbi:hypothetical protein A3Q56_02118 [Intoshia linei]|uniref:Uncharacterized protein n=1 Tax=Intoshia linei TaxID=1819745 RepID=A0A177B997_9BILA|nr:hypothetical protein A3Q56_02118 [Intoshia linei]
MTKTLKSKKDDYNQLDVLVDMVTRTMDKPSKSVISADLPLAKRSKIKKWVLSKEAVDSIYHLTQKNRKSTNVKNINNLIEIKHPISNDIFKDHMYDESECNVKHVAETDLGCSHAVYYRPKEIFKLSNFKGSQEFSFKLNDFQRSTINCVANDQSDMVASHTSSDKIVVPLYVIAICFKNNQKAIYTSSIKSLINQKQQILCQI